MKDEFNLSEKSQEIQGATMFGITDVKEFIKKYIERLNKVGSEDENGIKIIGVDNAIYELKKLAGDKLKQEERK